MISIIINADDLGNNPNINAEIENVIMKRAITSSTIMANSRHLEDVQRIVNNSKSFASFGVHLNLTEGESLTKGAIFRMKGVIDENGLFIKGNSKRCSYPDKELKKAIYHEWDAQITKLEQEGFVLSHADGHHHCHQWPGLEHVLVQVLKKHKIEKVRNCYLYPYASIWDTLLTKSCKVLYFFRVRKLKSRLPIVASISNRLHYIYFNHIIKSNNIKTTNYFGSYDTFLDLKNKSKLQENLNENIVYEMMCHPGILRYDKEKEQILQDCFGIKDSCEYRLITYNDL